MSNDGFNDGSYDGLPNDGQYLYELLMDIVTHHSHMPRDGVQQLSALRVKHVKNDGS